MAVKLGFEAIEFAIRKFMAKNTKGIASIPGQAMKDKIKILVDKYATQFSMKGQDINTVTVKQVDDAIDYGMALSKQKLKTIPKITEKTTLDDLVKGEKYIDERGRTWDFSPKVQGKPFDLFPGANLKVVPKATVDEHITFIKSKEPIESMKEANKVIKREGRYKNLTKEESQKILKDTDDHIFQRDIQYDEFGEAIKPEPEDFQSGGLAYMLGEPNTRIEALQHAGVIADPRGLYTDPSIYAKGESEIPQNYYEGGRIGLKKGSESWRDKLTRWAGGPNMLAGELGLEGIHQLHQLLGMGGLYSSGGRIKNFYEGGGVGRGPWTKGVAPGITEQPPQPETPIHHAQGRPDPTKLPQGLPSLAPRTMDPQYMQQQKMQQMMAGMGQQPRRRMDVGGMTQDDFDRYLRERKQRDEEDFKEDFLDDFDRWKKYQKERTVPVAEGGRIGFGLGGIDKGRRAFMKWLAGILGTGVAAGTGLIKLSKVAKVVPKVTETIVQSNAAGMPAWFPSLVKRVIKEGDDISKGAATAERQTVHSTKLPESGTPVQVTRDLITDDIIVDIGEQAKHGWGSGRHGQSTQLILKKGEWIEPTKGKKGIKTKDEFIVDEAEFTGGHPENVKFEESVQFKYGDHGSDFGEVERFAIGKNKDKKIIGKQAQKDAWDEGRAIEQAEDIDYASGGLAYMLGE